MQSSSTAFSEDNIGLDTDGTPSRAVEEFEFEFVINWAQDSEERTDS